MNDRLKSLFEDLGKPTLRGVRKCPKCGTYNGTRGISCKNKSCDAIFKEAPDRKKNACIDAVKIITGNSSQVYSVRVRDRGPDYRGFVQLSTNGSATTDATAVERTESAADHGVTDSTTPVSPTVSMCFVETCQKNNTASTDTCPNTVSVVNGSVTVNSASVCKHIKAASQCYTEAQPLTLKNSVLNSLQVSNETKQSIWLLATESTGPLVQRVSKNIMVVKCKPNPKHPLGFLHFAFFETSRNRESPEHKFHCSCRTFKNLKAAAGLKDEQKRCVHFYACICAFASNEKLADEFSYYINMDTVTIDTDPEPPLVAIFPVSETDDTPSFCEMNLISEDQIEPTAVVFAQQSLLPSPPLPTNNSDNSNNNNPTTIITKKRKKEPVDTLAQASSALLTLQDGSNQKKAAVKKIAGASNKKPPNVPIDETQVNVTFHQWLASVTERINQTMHYQFDGNPEPLVFHAPQVFFDCLQQRISTGTKKKRLPNSTTGFVRKDALPLGTFSKYTWHITNVLQVKQIFDTTEMPLEVLRSFVENRDGTYDLYQPPKSQLENVEGYRKTDNQPLIKPFELKTFLKVGTSSSDQKEPTPFVIEWIPDILPKMKIGELRIKFEYGHQRNGVIENRTSVPAHIIQIQSL